MRLFLRPPGSLVRLYLPNYNSQTYLQATCQYRGRRKTVRFHLARTFSLIICSQMHIQNIFHASAMSWGESYAAPSKARAAEPSPPEIMNQNLCCPRNIKKNKAARRLHIHITKQLRRYYKASQDFLISPFRGKKKKKRISLMSNDYCNNDISVDYANVIAGLSPSVP